ncbi:protein of unknown function [Shinella sp. WSC3-e]|nr:hypothetical protein SHINE37_40708 [Rhizobiaceae bacterium]CAK7255380.1 protein of unknown function [Shinella sp. WSC3-e]
MPGSQPPGLANPPPDQGRSRHARLPPLNALPKPDHSFPEREMNRPLRERSVPQCDKGHTETCQ